MFIFGTQLNDRQCQRTSQSTKSNSTLTSGIISVGSRTYVHTLQDEQYLTNTVTSWFEIILAILQIYNSQTIGKPWITTGDIIFGHSFCQTNSAVNTKRIFMRS